MGISDDRRGGNIFHKKPHNMVMKECYKIIVFVLLILQINPLRPHIQNKKQMSRIDSIKQYLMKAVG